MPRKAVISVGTAAVRVGTAAWGIPQEVRTTFPVSGTQLERYAAKFPMVEINSSFHRPHQRSTYERWAVCTPQTFRFAVKIPKTITHEHRLRSAFPLLDAFLAGAIGLGSKLACLLIQLPPSLVYERQLLDRFATGLRARYTGLIAIEPRHPSWFVPEVERVLALWQFSRVLADPVLDDAAARPGGWAGLVYLRLHGSPKTYWSSYGSGVLSALAERLRIERESGTECWCVFDNTASGAATANALELQGKLCVNQRPLTFLCA
jgi:uncharacterized protein YecE (DUF72 family)